MNQAGKEVLIKTVITTIPAYVMSIFHLPKPWCSEINSPIAFFWWGLPSKGKKTHWRRWDDLTTSKNSGGLGFR